MTKRNLGDRREHREDATNSKINDTDPDHVEDGAAILDEGQWSDESEQKESNNRHNPLVSESVHLYELTKGRESILRSPKEVWRVHYRGRRSSQ